MKHLTFLILLTATLLIWEVLAAAQDKSVLTNGAPVEMAPPVAQASSTPCTNTMTDEKRKILLEQIEADFKHYESGRKWWSKLYHGSIYGSALLSALAALILKLDLFRRRRLRKYRNDLSAILAFMAALLMTFSGNQEFYTRWQLDRLASKSTEDLRDDFNSKCMTVDDVRAKLSEIKHKQSEYKAEK
jgi:hypothetical protein